MARQKLGLSTRALRGSDVAPWGRVSLGNRRRADAVQAEATDPLAAINRPIAFPMVAELEKPVSGIVPFAATGTDRVSIPARPTAVIILSNSEARPAAARDEVEAQGASAVPVFSLEPHGRTSYAGSDNIHKSNAGFDLGNVQKLSDW